VSARIEDYDGAPELTGEIIYEPDWYLLAIQPEAQEVLGPLLDGVGVPVKASARPHISIMKGEAPSQNRDDWGTAFVGERVRFRFCPTVRDDNGLHLWVDCHSARLCEMRQHFGLVTLTRADGVHLVNFHLTVGRRKKAVERRTRAQLRLTPQSHIDVETRMQHL
jgi:hypothetical protein